LSRKEVGGATPRMKMVLILNCMKNSKLAVSFDRALSRSLEKAGKKADFIRVSKGETLPDPSGYSHVIVSGSEASVVGDSPWDVELQKAVLIAMENRVPLLGICYGHQFIARSIGGKGCVKRAEMPEFGWREIKLEDSPLFEGIETPVCMVSHYDAVYNLPGGFKVIASTPTCEVQAFQFKELQVWGVQFHPEYNEEEAREIFDLLTENDPPFVNYYSDEVFRRKEQLAQNEKVFLNFFSF
jgi:GMP synthase-like glutamine amidotransferase